MSVPTAGKETQNVRKARALSAENVTKEYLELAAPNQGSIIYEDGYRVREHQAEIEMAEWIHSAFGGDITLLKESKKPGNKTPDYLWNAVQWELKSVTTKNSVSRAVREAAKQIAAIPGGIILGSSASALAMEEIESEVRQRFKRVSLEAVDVMVVSKGQLRLIMRYKK